MPGRDTRRVSHNGNFPFWEILAAAVFSNNLFWEKVAPLALMTKSRHTARYDKLLRALKAARLEAGLTQAEVAKTFGAHASFVSKIESGERRVDVVELADFCQQYGVRLAVFLKRAGLE